MSFSVTKLKAEVCKEFGVAESALYGKRHLDNAKNAQACLTLLLAGFSKRSGKLLCKYLATDYRHFLSLMEHGMKMYHTDPAFVESYSRIKAMKGKEY